MGEFDRLLSPTRIGGLDPLGRVPELHVVGDAWAPRRLTVATRQGWELARSL